MYMTHLKTMLVQAMKGTFGPDYPEPTLRGLKVSIEFPIEQHDYPSIWVDFEPTGELEPIGIDHVEYADVEGGQEAISRWRYQGYATFTIAALSSLERDTIFDELVKVFALARGNREASTFRMFVEDNEWIAANIDFDQTGQRGFSASPGTPWQTDEVIYEATLSKEILGEFVCSNESGVLIPISAIVVQEYTANEEPPW